MKECMYVYMIYMCIYGRNNGEKLIIEMLQILDRIRIRSFCLLSYAG